MNEKIIMQSYSGLYIDLLDIAKDDLLVIDMAHALGNQCRYGGHTSKFYSVAEHSVIASKLGEFFCRHYPDEMCNLMGLNTREELEQHQDDYLLALLMHDASEAYLSDVITPVKRKLPDYQIIEDRIQGRVEELLSLSTTKPEESWAIKVMDIMMLIIESVHLLPNSQPIVDEYFPRLPDFMQVWFKEEFDPHRDNWAVPLPMLPEEAKESFLRRFSDCMIADVQQQELQLQ